MPPLGAAEPFGGGNEGPWEDLHLFGICDSPDGTEIVTVSPSEITAYSGRVWQELGNGGMLQ